MILSLSRFVTKRFTLRNNFSIYEALEQHFFGAMFLLPRYKLSITDVKTWNDLAGYLKAPRRKV